MSSAKLHSSKNSVIVYCLATQLEKEIPDVDIYGAEKKLLDFAYHDLETCIRLKWRSINSEDIEEALNEEDNQEEIKAFVKVWTKQWLEKWRERVTLCQKMPRFSLQHIKAKRKATKLFQQMEDGQELKDFVVQKLINQGEVCMPELIAENLVIEQIAFTLKAQGGASSADNDALKPWQIFCDVLPQVKSLVQRKTPIIHMKLMTGSEP
jgi:ribosomal protein L20A (L18A)